MKQAKLILVGGFLGAGKTTLLAQASKILVRRGMRVGLITNDQAADLVDTETLRQVGMTVMEIAGGCFCCKFPDLVSAASRLANDCRPDVLIGEPVGSCTDLSATVLQPLKEHHASQFSLAPFSVLVDPIRLREALNPDAESSLHPSARYILRKQLEEADIIVLNKIDLLASEEHAELEVMARTEFFGVSVRAISALSSEGVEGWIDEVLKDAPAGRRIVPVDYDIYAEGEAVLGWLNATVQLLANQSTDWQEFCSNLLCSLRGKCRERNAEIVHVKLILESSTGSYLVGNLTSNGADPSIRGSLDNSERYPELTINARVQISPDSLEGLVRDSLRETAGSRMEVRVVDMASLSPGRPQPTYRYEIVV